MIHADDLHFCHAHPLGSDAPARIWCGCYCYDRPCRLFMIAWRLGRLIGR